MWITYWYASLVQLMLLCSVYVIHFQSTLLDGLEPQKSLMKYAPADRLVVFVVDGLSARRFFEQRCRNVPHLRQMFLQQGQVGICYARSSTNWRSAYVARFAGFDEDHLAGGDFDSIFNRSTRSYAWGSAELLQHFPALHKIHMHPDDIKNITMLDNWTLRGFQLFLEHEASKLQQLRGLVFLVQLMGGDRLKYTEQRIWGSYKQFEHAFPDQRTAYVLTSGQAPGDELATPLFVWGAGVSNANATPGRSFVANERGQRLPQHVLAPIQLAPLLCGLLALPPPVHNRGQLPAGLLNGSVHEAHARYSNARQLLGQALRARQQHGRGLLTRFMPDFWLNEQQLDGFVHSGHLLWHQQRYLTLIEYCDNFMPVLLQCTDYYHRYYRRALLLATASGYLAWLHHLRCWASAAVQVASLPFLVVQALVRLLLLLGLGFVLLQRLPWLVCGVLLVLPGLIWMLTLAANARSVKRMSCRLLMLPTLLSLCCIAGFFHRRFVALVYLSFACFNNRGAFKRRSLHAYLWFLLVCALCAVSWLPPSLGHWQRQLLLASLLLTLVRPLACRTLQPRTALGNGLVLLAAALHVLLSAQPWLLHLLARSYLCYMFYSRFRQPGLELVVYNLSTVYALLCTSYEALVIQALAFELQLALRLKRENNEAINQTLTLAMYILVYSFYSLFAIGNIEGVPKFLFHMHFTGLGCYSTLINGFLVALKLLLPLLLLQVCIVDANCYLNGTCRRVFRRLSIMCNVMALVLLFRVRSDNSWHQDSIRLSHFIIVQLLPFVWLLLSYLAHFLLRYDAKEVPALPKWNVNTY